MDLADRLELQDLLKLSVVLVELGSNVLEEELVQMFKADVLASAQGFAVHVGSMDVFAVHLVAQNVEVLSWN